MFSQTVEYILRVIVFLAAKRDDAVTTQQISAATHVPVGYLAKIMQRLVKAGLVNSQRGRNGGFVLTERSYKLSVYDVIQLLEPIERVTKCPMGVALHGTTLCPLHRRIDKAIAGVEKTLQEATIADLMSARQPEMQLA